MSRFPEMRYFLISALAALAVLLAPPASAQRPDDFVRSDRGTLPLVFSAPHGGSETIPGVPPRTSGSTTADLRTLELAQMVADRIENELCGRPYLVGALFHRRFVDANREPHLAFEDPRAAVSYFAYHERLGAAVSEVAEMSESGLLIDFHGQAQSPTTIYRGTRDGRTMQRLVGEWGRDVLAGPSSLMGWFAAGSYDVFPPVDSDEDEDRRYNGGYIVATYGSHDETGIDAIQIELGSALRATGRLPSLADDVATAIAGFMRQYVPNSDLCAVTSAA